jgi:hypothetical protein
VPPRAAARGRNTHDLPVVRRARAGVAPVVAVDERHRDEHLAFVLADVVNGDDMR